MTYGLTLLTAAAAGGVGFALWTRARRRRERAEIAMETLQDAVADIDVDRITAEERGGA